MNKRFLSIGALIAGIVLFFAVNIIVGAWLHSARVDFTEGRLYTLSQGSRNIAKLPSEPVKLTLYYTDRQADDAPGIKAYATRVREVLQEYVLSSGGKIELKIVNPEPFSDAEDKAVQAGIVGVPTGRSTDRLYFGLVGANSVDRQEIIPFFDPQKENFLEYDLSHMLYLLADQPRKPVGLMSWLPMEGSQGNPMMGSRGTPAWQIDTQLKELFDIKPIPTNTTEIPADIKVLVVIHPKTISERTQYAIDQFVLRGGKLVLFVDPLCEADQPPGINPMQAMNLPRSSDVPKLLAAWGLELVPGKIAGDQASALKVNVGSQNRPETVDYLAWLQLNAERHDQNDPVTGQLGTMIVASSGILAKKDGATLEITPLLRTSAIAAPIDASSIQFIPDPKKLLAEFKPGNKDLMLAARITGKAKTAFPDGLPPPDPKVPEVEQPKPPTAEQIKESAEPVNIIAIADCDMLTDRFWAQHDRLGQIDLGIRKISDNGDFVVGAIDNLSGSSDLMSLRARGKFARPFETVLQLQKDAEQRYHAKEQELQANLRETEAKINEVQKQRPDGKSAVVLTPEQSQEIEKFRKQMVDTRKELREVQHQLRKDIEGLGTKIKVINMGLMPVLVGIAALGLAGYRSARRRADRESIGAKG